MSSALLSRLAYYRPSEKIKKICLVVAKYGFRFSGYTSRTHSLNFVKGKYYLRVTEDEIEVLVIKTAESLFKGTTRRGFNFLKKIGMKKRLPRKPVPKIGVKRLTKEERARKKALKEIESEISFYEPKPSIRNAMLKLGRMGFVFSGHGCGMGAEDFGLYDDRHYVSLSDYGQKVLAMLSTNPEDDESPENLFEGTIGQLFKFMEKKLLYAIPQDENP